MRGVLTALVTPFNERNEIDFPAFRKLLETQVEARIAGVIPCGTTGESATLSEIEKKNLIRFTLDELRGTSVKVFAGTGSNHTEESLQLSIWASNQGVDGLLLVTPYYNRPSQKGLEIHFRTIAEAVSCEVILYNVPGRTGVSLAPDTITQLSSHSRINTLKEASGNVAFTTEILNALALQGRSLDILSGDDATFLALLAVGAVGTVSVASNLFPKPMVALLKAVAENQLETARQIHQKYYPLFRDLFIESNPVPIKYALARQKIGRPHVRLPLAPLSSESMIRLEKSLTQCGF